MRLEDWPERLGTVLRVASRTPFAYGTHDCILHAGDGALAVTGVDPVATLRGGYSDYLSGLRLLKAQEGLTSIWALADARFTRQRTIARAQRGDWAMVNWPAVEGGKPHKGMTIVDGDRLCGPCGVRLPLTAATLVWRVE